MFDFKTDVSPSSNLACQKRVDLVVDFQTFGLFDLATPYMLSTKDLRKLNQNKLDELIC